MLIPVAGISCSLLLTILKLTGIMEWCWTLVFTPIFIPLLIIILIFVLGDSDERYKN